MNLRYYMLIFAVVGIVGCKSLEREAKDTPHTKVCCDALGDAIPPPTRQALLFLERTDRFSSVRVGAAGTLSFEAIAFSMIADSPNKNAIFHHLYEHGGAAGKIYALIGLYYDDKDFVYREIEKLVKANIVIEYMSGCSVSKESISETLKSSSSHAVRLSAEIPTVSLWLDVNSPVQRSYVADVYGGAYSDEFFEIEAHEEVDFLEELERRGAEGGGGSEESSD